jgi:putative transposase
MATMEYSHRYPAYPTQEVAAELDRHIDIHRQAYNYTRYEYTHLREDTENIGSAYKHHDRLTDWKDEFSVFKGVHSKALQRTVTRFYQNLSNLKSQKENGNKVGMLKWKSPREFQSMTYSQSGFELKNTSGRHATLWLSKIGDIKLRYHREILDTASIKEVTIKRERRLASGPSRLVSKPTTPTFRKIPHWTFFTRATVLGLTLASSPTFTRRVS